MHNFYHLEKSVFDINLITNIILDVEKYHEFIPWCKNIRIVDRRDSYFIAETFVQFKSFTGSYKSKVSYTKTDNSVLIYIESIDGPLKYLTNRWTITNLAAEDPYKTSIEFEIKFSFKSIMLNSLTSLFFGSAAKKIIDIFTKRTQDQFNKIICKDQNL